MRVGFDPGLFVLPVVVQIGMCDENEEAQGRRIILQGAIEAVSGLVIMVSIIGLCAGVSILEIADAMAPI